MKRISKVNLNLLLTLCVVCISMLYPMTARAVDKIPGGNGNHVTIISIIRFENGYWHDVKAEYFAQEDYEIIGYLSDDGTSLYMYTANGGTTHTFSSTTLSDYLYTAVIHNKNNDIVSSSYSSLTDGVIMNSYQYTNSSDRTVTISVSGMKIFSNQKSALAYVEDGSLDGMIKEPELDKDWYLENVGYKVDADDSPTSEAGEDATYITFTWSTDNLQDGDLLEIKTHNYLKKIGGDQISGFHDYITNADNVSAYSGKYRFSQYDATKAWFNTLDNKPLIFKSYDTDIYYLRPYRNGVYGGWVKITIGRSPVIKGSPYVEDIEYGDFDEDDDWVTDEELTEKNGGHHGVDQNGNITYPDTDNPFEGTNVTGIFKWFFDFMKEIPSFLGDLPSLVGSIIGFLPPQINGFIALGVVVAIILRIVGR